MEGHELTELALAAGDDEESLDTVVREISGELRSFTSKRVPVDDVDDVMQDIWIGLVRSISGFAGKSSFRTWFYSLARRRIANYYRKCERVLNNEWKRTVLSPTRLRVDFESDIELEQLLCQMPEVYRDALRDLYISGYSYEECAEERNWDYEAMRSNHRRALAWCHSHLEYLGLQ